jgi:zinc finger BED domain-containing protein 1 (E3 SUMO-protein ligase ZBED1)
MQDLLIGNFVSINYYEPKELSLWYSFDSISQASKKLSGTSSSRSIIEVERFLENILIDRKADPLEWWRLNKCKYPILSIVAQENLCALASSVPCERLFSKSGQIISDRRCRLSADKTKFLLFLNSNIKYC